MLHFANVVPVDPRWKHVWLSYEWRWETPNRKFDFKSDEICSMQNLLFEKDFRIRRHL